MDDEILKIVRANQSPRYRRLEELESWVNGTQYDGKCSWWDDDQPLWDRAPCIVYPIVANAIQSNVDLVLGEGRFPEFTANPGEDEGDEENGTDEEESSDVDRYIDEYHELCQFPSHCREAFYAAQQCGTTVAIHGVRNGKPFANLIPAKWGTPEFDNNGECVRLTIKYPFLEEVQQKDGTWKLVVKLYKRVIDARTDVTYKQVEARPDGNDPVPWPVDDSLTVNHNLGFCPVVWYPFMRTCAPVNQIDGYAIHSKLTDEIQAHDIAISQRHRCALLSEPQICEIGVSPGENPTSGGETPRVVKDEKGGHYTETAGGGKPARKKGPSYVWQYQNPNTKVEVLTIGADALKAQDDNARDIRLKLQESLGVVTLDPENIKFAATTSGKALQQIKQRQLDRCDQYRDDLKNGFLLPSIKMQLRISKVLGAKQLKVPGIEDVVDAIADMEMDPALTIKWGPYFPADADDQVKIVTMVQQALGSGGTGEQLITKEIAVETIADVFGIENTQAVLDALEEEQAERDARELEKTKEEQKTLHAIAGSAPGSGSGGNPRAKPVQPA